MSVTEATLSISTKGVSENALVFNVLHDSCKLNNDMKRLTPRVTKKKILQYNDHPKTALSRSAMI